MLRGVKELLEQKNDDTKTKLGDIYHYYIVLQHCLNLQEDEVLYVEKYGDISVTSNEKSVNIEIKHHDEEHQLNDRNTDFWKTIRNWVKYHENMRQFKSLLLFTTSDFPDKSKLENWNILSGEERLDVLKEIGKEVKLTEKTFRPYYNEIFTYDERILVELLKKTEL